MEKEKPRKSKFKQFVRMLFSKTTIVALFLLVSLALIVYSVFYFTTLFWVTQLISYLISFVAVIHLSNRDMMVDLKVPWFLAMVFAPLVSSICYFLFSSNAIYRKSKKRYAILKSQADKYLEITENAKDVQFSQAKYIENQCSLSICQNTQTKYYYNGESFWNDLCEELKKAKKYIFMEYFIINRGEMWHKIYDILKQKAKDGVEIKILYDDWGSLNGLPFTFVERLKKYGVEAKKFNAVRPVFTAIQNNRDHRKITIIDGKVAFVGSSNIADEYANLISRFGYWKDANIKVAGKAVKNLIILYLEMYYLNSKDDVDFEKYIKQVKNVESDGYVVPYGAGPKALYNDYVAESVYLNMIYQAKKYVWIMSPYFIISQRLKTALENASLRGVDVRIIVPHIPDKKIIFLQTKNMYKSLLKQNIKIYQYLPGFIHSKTILCDDSVAVVGTVNMDYRSLVHHYECGVWLKDCSTIVDIKNDFEHTFEVSEIQTEVKMNILTSVFAGILTFFMPLL